MYIYIYLPNTAKSRPRSEPSVQPKKSMISSLSSSASTTLNPDVADGFWSSALAAMISSSLVFFVASRVGVPQNLP